MSKSCVFFLLTKAKAQKKFSLSLGMLLGVCHLSPGAKIQRNLKPSIHSRLLQSFGGVGHPHEEGGWMNSLLSKAGSKGGRTFSAQKASFRLVFFAKISMCWVPLIERKREEVRNSMV